MATRRFSQQTNVLTSDYTNALDRNTGVDVSKRLSEVIAQAYTRDYYKFQSNTFFALVIGQTETRSTDVRTARNTFSQLEFRRESQAAHERQELLDVFRYPSCKVRILETGHSFLGDPTDPDGVFKLDKLNDYSNSATPRKLRALNIAYSDMHGFPAYATNGGYPEYGDVVLVEVDNVSEPRDIKILEIVAKKIIAPLDFSGGDDIDPPAPQGRSGILGRPLDLLEQATGSAAVLAENYSETGELKLVVDQFQEFSVLSSNPYPNISQRVASRKRKYAVQPQLLGILQSAASASNASLVIRSAGQPSEELILSYTGTYPLQAGQTPDLYRTGSVRHNFGWAVDVELYSLNNGQQTRIGTNVETASTELTNFLTNAYREGITGIGAGPRYMTAPPRGYGEGWIHLDIARDANIGAPGTNYWAKRGEDPPTWLIDAYNDAQPSNTSVATNTTTEEEEADENPITTV